MAFSKMSLSRGLTMGLLLVVFYYWYLTAALFNPVAIVLAGLLFLHLLRDKKLMGLVLGGVFIVLSLYMFLALFSEFRGVQISQSSEFLQGTIYLLFTLSLAIATFAVHLIPARGK